MMKIIVLIKQVPGTANTRMDPKTGVMIRDAGETILNPLDEHALAEAVVIKKRNPGAEVIALTMGPPSAQKVLREACARGADKGILLSHKAFGGSDTVATSRVLAAAIGKIGAFDIVLAGEKATDGETGQTGPMTAALLDIPVVTFVHRLEVNDNHINARRILEEGVEEVRVKLPALVTVVKDINNPPLPTLRGYITAKKLSFPVWGPAELGVEENTLGLKGSPTRVVKVFTPKLSRQTTFYTADTEEKMSEAAQTILTALQSRGLMGEGDSYGS
ncbi:electron transfer flavoprotein subunit beta/FixA family protein [Desulfallas thermosapovorans]|uniref:Electron transfer flavoprotein small subunit n=1 Tax=Desulfallas thermosapovorans DSM 6562 TaxID=1121431 RepID=A0A5S4ZP27_9FIRM|nr:electron transfer flavoprotein subunit beta/FixA family protein [Desulfallas thermosapovorans]TYO93899.1 electron transfer flavoprotein beta subunit [Desulfallas thermosapovorans DSM 6562]